MKILKFGGSSTASAERIKRVVEIIKNYHNAKTKIAVVFSAFGGVTDELIEVSKKALLRDDSYLEIFQKIKIKHLNTSAKLITHKNKKEVKKQIENYFNELSDILKGIYLLKELTPRILDKIMSYGEKLSNYIISETLKSSNIKAEFLDTSTIIKTDNTFGNARINVEKTNKNILEHFGRCSKMQIITGFIASNEKNDLEFCDEVLFLEKYKI